MSNAKTASFMSTILRNTAIDSKDGYFVKFNDVPKNVEDKDLAEFILKGVAVAIYKKENSDVYLNFKRVSQEYTKFTEIPGRELVKYDMFFKLDHGDQNAKIKMFTYVLPVLFVYLMEENQDIVDIYSTKFKLKDIMKDLEDNIPINITDEEKPEHTTYGKRLFTVFGNYTFLPATH